MEINLRGKLYSLAEPKIMGIINITPDSFYAGSRVWEFRQIAATAEKMLSEGADMLDIGGYSTRPGAEDVTSEEEFRRVALGIEAARSVCPEAVISVDTFRSDVARRCVEELKADIVNDISGGDLDPEMFATVATLRVPYVLMHTRGTPAEMQKLCSYTDVVAEVIEDLARKQARLRALGACDIILDPGFGFAKDLEQNYRLMAFLEEFRRTGAPLLVGISRKSMIYKLLDTAPEEALNGTTVLNTVALLKGANILRVHDVKPAAEARAIVARLQRRT